MEGFFTKRETESISRPDGKAYSCVSCGLYKDCKNPKMKPYGNFKKKILNIGEAPNEADDLAGRPWQGRVGKLLQRTYAELGVDLFEDCLNINAVHCRVVDTDGDDRIPTNYEVGCCRKAVLKIIADYKPDVIVLFGVSALFSLIGHRWKKDFGTLTKWRGWNIPDQDFNTWLCPTYHPEQIEKSDADDVIRVIWKNDIKEALEKRQISFRKYHQPKIEIIEDLNILNSIKPGTLIVPDFETTGKKPHALGHKIVCCSIADSQDHVYVFMVPDSRKARQPLVDLLANKNIPKAGQNIKFEHVWSSVIFRQPINNWYHDTMLASHYLDNRRGITSLKFQTYVQFGIVDYASEITPYLETSKDSSGNAINRIFDLINKPGGKEKLLKYCGYDSINEYRLTILQKDIFEYNDLPFNI